MGGYKATVPTCYVVDWPEAGVFKIGYSAKQRWRTFVLRGADVVALYPFPLSTGAFHLETYFENYALMLYRQAFTAKTDEARDLLGPSAAGYLECHRGDGHEFHGLMLKHCSAGIAQIGLAASNASTATNERNETNLLRPSSPSRDTSCSVTRTRTYGGDLDG